MQTMTQTENKIEFAETMSTGTRVFLFIVGLLPWLAPYEFFIKNRWNEFSLLMIFFIIISLGAIAVSMAFIGAAIFGMNQTTTFDLDACIISHRYETTVNALREKRYSFRDIAKSDIHEHDWENGPNTYSLKFHFKDKHKIRCGDFSSRAEAELVLHQIR